MAQTITTYILMACLLIAGIIHVLPITGLLGAEQLSALYGIDLDDPNLIILMRHRAVLFALLGLLLIYSAFRKSYMTIAISAGLISTATFLWLAWSTADYNEELGVVVSADIVALACLVVACALNILKPAK